MTETATVDRPIGRLLRRKEVEAEVGLCRSAIYARMKAGTFPTGRIVGKRARRWPESEVEAWKRGQPPG